MSFRDSHPTLKVMERIDGQAQALQESAINFRGEVHALISQRDTLAKALLDACVVLRDAHRHESAARFEAIAKENAPG